MITLLAVVLIFAMITQVLSRFQRVTRRNADGSLTTRTNFRSSPRRRPRRRRSRR